MLIRLPSLEEICIQVALRSIFQLQEVCLSKDDSSNDTSELTRLYILAQLRNQAELFHTAGLLLRRAIRTLSQQLKPGIVFPSLCNIATRQLRVKRCHYLGVEDLLRGLQRAPYLRQLDLTRSSQLVCASMLSRARMMDSLSHLTDLILDQCDTVTDLLVHMLFDYEPWRKHLRLLSLNACHNITDNAFNLEPCREHALSKLHLHEVRLAFCQLSSTAVLHLVACCGQTLLALDLTGTQIDHHALLYLSGFSLLDVLKVGVVLRGMRIEKVCSDVTLQFCERASTPQHVCPRSSHDGLADGISFDFQLTPVFASPRFFLADANDAELPARQSSSPLVAASAASSIPCRHASCCFVQQFYRPVLRSLKLSAAAGLSLVDEGLKCLTVLLTACADTLHTLELESCRDVGDSVLEALADLAPRLLRLSLFSCETLSSVAFSQFAHRLKHLRHLNVQGVAFIGDAGVEPLLSDEDCALEEVYLGETYITDRTLIHLSRASFASQLRCLDLCWCEDISPEGVAALAGVHWAHLELLNLRKMRLAPKDLIELVSRAPKLAVLDISGSQHVDDADESAVNDDVMTSVAIFLPRLEKLNISWNVAITDRGLISLLSAAPQLQVLMASGLKRVTSAPFLPIIHDLRKWRRTQALLRLKLEERTARAFNRYRGVDDDSSSDEEYDFLHLPTRSAIYAPHLRRVDLDFCNLVSNAHIAELVAVSRGSLHITDYYGVKVKPHWQKVGRGSALLRRSLLQ